MHSDQFVPEADFYAHYFRRRKSRGIPSDRAWVQREFDFWYRCTVVDDDGTMVTVALDNLDELTVPRDRVEPFNLERGDLVFVRHWDGSPSGSPAFVVSVQGETAVVEFPWPLFPKTERYNLLLRELRFYADPPATPWQPGMAVFAYKSVRFYPELYLRFPAIVRKIHFDVCVEVEFGDGETAHVPTTLVQPQEVAVGDTVHTCTSYLSHGVQPDERWSPCRVVERSGTNLLLTTDTGQCFEAPLGLIAVQPSGYRVVEGKLHVRAESSEAPAALAAMDAPLPTDVHIVRTDRWLDAADDPITKPHVDALIAADAELEWSRDVWDKVSAASAIINRALAIRWRGQACFWWYRHGIRCTSPNAEELAKMIDMAVALDANVIGTDGTEYH
jgi:hypothetical protein